MFGFRRVLLRLWLWWRQGEESRGMRLSARFLATMWAGRRSWSQVTG